MTSKVNLFGLDRSAMRALFVEWGEKPFRADQVMQWLHRLRRFRKVIEHIVKHRERVWLTRPGEICRHIESLPPGVVPGS